MVGPMADMWDSERFDPRRIQALRAQLGLSQSDLARRIGIHRRTLRNWETGQNRPNAVAMRILEGLEANAGRSAVIIPFPTQRERAARHARR